MNAWDVGQLLLWVVVLFNLLLTVALARRVAALGAAAGTSTGAPVGGLPAGSAAPPFVARTPDGVERARGDLGDGPLVLGFFSPTCEACYDHVVHFAELAGRAAPQGITTVAVVDGDTASAARLLDRLPDGVPVLLAARPENPFLGAYLVDAYPTYTVVVDGSVVGSFGSVPELNQWLSATTARVAGR